MHRPSVLFQLSHFYQRAKLQTQLGHEAQVKTNKIKEKILLSLIFNGFNLLQFSIIQIKTPSFYLTLCIKG